MITTVDDIPAVTKYTYNGLGQVTSKVDPEGNVTSTHYDYGFVNEHGETVSQKTTVSPKGIMTVVTHDIMGRTARIETVNPFGLLLQRSDRAYDLCGNCIEEVHTVITP